MASSSGEISSLEGAGLSKSAATSFVGNLNFGGSPGRTHFLDESELGMDIGLPDAVDDAITGPSEK
jgi:hypothetical protein